MTLTNRPAAIPLPDAAAFPPALLALRHWVAYALEGREGGLTKIPYNPHTGGKARSNDPATWGTFAEARAFAARRGMGVGLMLAPPLVGIDIDDCRDPETDVLTPVAASVVGELDTYWEISVSGTGIKGVAYGAKPGVRCRRKGLKIEIYDHARLFALTGRRLPDAPLAINDCQEGLDFIYGVAFGQEEPQPAVAWDPAVVTADDDRAVIDWLHHARNGAKFARYWGGQDDGDPSGGDMGLANMIAWRVGPDPSRIEAIFNASARADRAKWQRRPAYREATIRKAIERCNGRFYEARPAPRPVAPPPVEEERSSSAPLDPALAEYLALSHEALARRAYRAERFNKAYLRFDKNKQVKTQKPTLRAVLFEYDNKARGGKLDAEGWAPTSLAAIGDLGGASKDAAGDHLREIAGWGVGIEKDVRDEEYRVPVANGGEIVQKRPRLYIKVDGDVVDKLEELAVFEPPKREGKGTWGGKREPCPRCGSVATRTVTYCGGCDLILRETTHEPEGLPEDEVGNIPAMPVEDLATYPPEQVDANGPVYAREPEAEEGDDWDEYECNHPGCVRPVVIGRRFCGQHRHLGIAPDAPPVPPPAAPRPPAPAGWSGTHPCADCGGTAYARAGETPRCLPCARGRPEEPWEPPTEYDGDDFAVGVVDGGAARVSDYD